MSGPLKAQNSGPSSPRPTDAKETDRLLPQKDQKNIEQEPPLRECDCTFGCVDFIWDLNDHFGHKLLWLLFAAQFLVKGFFKSFVSSGNPYIFKLYHLQASQTQVYNSVISLPWAMKPIIGLVTDILPIRGFNKAPYMFLASILGVVSCFLVGLDGGKSLAVIVIVMCFFTQNLQMSTADLLSEAKYAERMRASPSHGPALLTYVWFGMQVAGLVAVLCSGWIIQAFGPRSLYVIGAFPAASILIPVALNYFEEKELSPDDISKARARFFAQKEMCFMCLFIGVVCIVMTLVGLYCSAGVTAGIGVGFLIIIMIGVSVMLSPILAKFNVFAILQSAMKLGTGGATFYFYTDTPEQYPDGPHFSPFFYNSVLGVTTSVCSLIGIYLYQRYMSKWKYRNIFVATNLAYCLICLPDIIMFKRLNVKWGIPDHVFILGASCMENIVYQWQWMPLVVILSYLCPKGMEATMYALLAGSFNLGGSMSSNFGAVVLNALGVQPSGLPNEGKQFDNLWIASLISSMLPAVTVASLYFLIPDARQGERILDADEESATAGSLWRKWTGADGQPHRFAQDFGREPA